MDEQEYNKVTDENTSGWVRTNPTRPNNLKMTDSEKLWLSIRQAVLLVLGAIEVYLGMERSVKPRRKR